MKIAELASRVTLCYTLSDLTEVEANLSMTSREIAELTGKEHFNVLRDIRTTLEELGLEPSSVEKAYQDSQGRQQLEFDLDEELALTVVSGYSTVLRNLIVRQWLDMRKLVSSQQQEIDKLRQAEILRLRNNVARESNRANTAKAFSALTTPALLKKYRSSPELQAEALMTFQAEQDFLLEERKFAFLYDNTAKELGNAQDKLRELDNFTRNYCKLKSEYSGMRYPYLLEVLAYSRPLSSEV